MLKYYNDETKTLTIPFDYNKEINDIPDNTKNIKSNAKFTNLFNFPKISGSLLSK